VCIGAFCPLFLRKSGELIVKPKPVYQRDVWKSIDKTGKIFDEPVTEIPSWKNWSVSFDHFGDETRKRIAEDGIIETINLSYSRVPPFLVKMGNLRGFVNESGTFVIEPKYKYAERFRDGLALVTLDYKDWTMIDKSGAVKFTLPAGQRPETRKLSARGNLLVSKRDSGNLLAEFSVYNVRTGQLTPLSSAAASDEFKQADTFSEELARKFLKQNSKLRTGTIGKSIDGSGFM
jgi:WG containing repeat